MVDAGDAAAVRHRLVERIAGRGGAEQFAIGGAEALDAVLVEQGLGGGQQGEAVDPVDAALGRGIEAAHALDLVAEEIEPQRLLLARPGRGRRGRRAPRTRRDRAPSRCGRSHSPGAARVSRSRSIRSPGASRATSWRMRNGVSVRWVAALTVVTSSCGFVGWRAAARAASPAARRSRAATASCGRRAGSPRPGRSSTSSSGAK